MIPLARTLPLALVIGLTFAPGCKKKDEAPAKPTAAATAPAPTPTPATAPAAVPAAAPATVPPSPNSQPAAVAAPAAPASPAAHGSAAAAAPAQGSAAPGASASSAAPAAGKNAADPADAKEDGFKQAAAVMEEAFKAAERAEGANACERAYHGLEIFDKALAQAMTTRGKAKLPSRAKFLALCGELPAPAQECLVINHMMKNQETCTKTLDGVEPKLRDKMERLMGKPAGRRE